MREGIREPISYAKDTTQTSWRFFVNFLLDTINRIHGDVAHTTFLRQLISHADS